MGLNYELDNMRKRHADQNYFNGLERQKGGSFPSCQGIYDDCPKKPSLLDNKCRNCPKTDDIKKPKLEWVVCEHCGEDGVPVDSQSKLNENEEIKCHICDKMNSVEYIAKQRN
jgi:hypothetical protein